MPERQIEIAGPRLARILFGWDTPMWRYRNPWGPWQQGEPPIDNLHPFLAAGGDPDA